MISHARKNTKALKVTPSLLQVFLKGYYMRNTQVSAPLLRFVKKKTRAIKCEPSHAGGNGRASSVSRFGPLPHKHICSEANKASARGES